jgi:hypothetical protein
LASPPAGHAALGDGDQALDKRAQLFGARHGGLDVLVLDERVCLIAEHRDAMVGDPAEFSMGSSMAHI